MSVPNPPGKCPKLPKLPKMRLRGILILLILILGVYLRFYDLSGVPNGLHWDEMDTGYQAFSLIRTGRDYFGNPLPLFFHSIADFRTPVLLYLSVLPVKLFGLTPFAIRFPSAVLGVISLFLFYLLSQRKAALFVLLTACLSPWLVHYSRQGVESMTMITFLLLAVVTWHRGWLSVSALLFGLTMASYSPAKLFVPLLVGFLVLRYRPRLSLLTCTLFLIPCTLILGDSLLGQSGLRFRQLSIINDPTLSSSINYQREYQQIASGQAKVVGLSPRSIDKITLNKPLHLLTTFLGNYLSAFSTDFLFLRGDQELRHSPGQDSQGMLLLPEFIPLGLVILNLGSLPILAFWLLAGPVGASLTLTGNPHAARLSLWLPVLILLSGYGSYLLFRYSKFLTACYWVLVSLFALSYYAYFFANYRWESAQPFQYGFPQVITWATKQSKPVILDMGEHSGLMAYLFTTSYPPKAFQAKTKNLQTEIAPGVYGYSFGPISITQPGSRFWPNPPTAMAVYAHQSNADKIPGRVGELLYPDGTPAFYFISLP